MEGWWRGPAAFDCWSGAPVVGFLFLDDANLILVDDAFFKWVELQKLHQQVLPTRTGPLRSRTLRACRLTHYCYVALFQGLPLRIVLYDFCKHVFIWLKSMKPIGSIYNHNYLYYKFYSYL